MEHSIDELITKIEELDSKSSQTLISEVESLLRGINNKQAIPEHLTGKVYWILTRIDKKREYFVDSEVPYIVIQLVKKITSGQKANTGTTLNEGYNCMKKSFHDSHAAYKIIGKFSIPLFRI